MRTTAEGAGQLSQAARMGQLRRDRHRLLYSMKRLHQRRDTRRVCNGTGLDIGQFIRWLALEAG